MKKITIATLTILSSATLLFAQHRYQEKSGVIEYEINANGEVMGIETKITGTNTQHFKDYGNIFLTKEKTTQVTMGTKQVSKIITKLDNDTLYSADLKNKIIIKYKLDDKMKKLSLVTSNEKNLKKNGAKKRGSETIAGYKCDIWDLKDETMCIYKGIPLKITSTQAGLTNTQIAKSVKFGSVSEEELRLPPYPIKTKGDLIEDMKKEIQQQIKDASPEEKKMMEDMLKKIEAKLASK